ncbi:MAG TPA: ABC transporter substrate-binding protein [Solirubrobacteraceae bacterium]|jgi:polar amino acid transport system substrate-binding protein|nr:ABC transporter substrate-binding protein [Solirubrobacteraceae bacterium]
MRTWKSVLSVAITLLSAAAIVGCGSSSSSSSSATSSAAPAATGTSSAATSSAAAGSNAAVAALVPSSIKSKGALTVAADASYAPNEFIGPDGHTVVGMDADLSAALAKLMGLKANVVNATFDTIIPGLAAGKYDMGASSFTDTKAREKVVDFVDYFQAGTSFFTKSSGGVAVTNLASLCGKTVSVESGTTEETDAKGQSAKCKSAGKPAVSVLVFPTQTAANLALNSGRAQVSMADSPVAAYQVKQSHGAFKLVGQTYGTAPYGLAIPKHSGLAPAVLAGVKALIKDGTYNQILTKWGITSGALPASQVKINGAIS